jgi:hypothetical protein
VLRSSKLLLTVVVAHILAIGAITQSKAGPVTLPFNESFNTPSNDTSFSTNYPAFTTTGVLSRTVDAGGILRLGSGSVPASTFTTVTPFPVPAGGILINVDMGFNGGAGTGAASLKLGNNVINFHPGYNGPPGSFRVDGPGLGTNQDMGFVPQLGVLNHVQILSLPSGLFNITVTDGTNPANVYTTSFTNAASYGGEIGPAAAGAPSGMFDNLSITAVPEPASLVLAAAGLLGTIVSAHRHRRWSNYRYSPQS